MEIRNARYQELVQKEIAFDVIRDFIQRERSEISDTIILDHITWLINTVKEEKQMTTKRAIILIEQINPIIKHSTSYVRRLEIDEEDKSIKFMTFFGDVIHRHYYSQNTNAIDLCSDIFEYLDWR